MKGTAYTMIAMAVLVGSMAVAAQAQSVSCTELRANIPFQFNVGSKTLPAGEYRVSQVNPASDHAVLELHSKNGAARALLQMKSVIGKAQESAKLIFNRYGNQYYFSQVWIEGDTDGLEAPKLRAERAAEREFAALNMAREAVTVAANH